MARIRTVKPETPQDERLARVSRDARLTFIYLLTVADDAGYFRASLRYLLGVLFPHDDDVTPERLKGWLKELTDNGQVEWKRLNDGSPVGYIVNFAKHQRIDRPSRSFLREEVARASRKPREDGASVSREPTDGGAEPSHALVELRSTLVPDTAAIEHKTQERVTKEQALRLAANVVFSYWHARMGKTARTILDPKRERLLIARLRENGGDVTELLYVVDGALRDDFLMGRDPKATRKNDGVELLFRDRAHVERLRDAVPKRLELHPFLNQRASE